MRVREGGASGAAAGISTLISSTRDRPQGSCDPEAAPHLRFSDSRRRSPSSSGEVASPSSRPVATRRDQSKGDDLR